MSRTTSRRTADAPVNNLAPLARPPTHVDAAPLPRPTGRFDASVDMGNPMKGINLFPYLRRHVEGRALAAMGPTAVLELSRTVREVATPRRWPREVFIVNDFFIYMCFFLLDIFSVSVSPIVSASRGVAARSRFGGRSGQSTRPI